MTVIFMRIFIIVISNNYKQFQIFNMININFLWQYFHRKVIIFSFAVFMLNAYIYYYYYLKNLLI